MNKDSLSDEIATASGNWIYLVEVPSDSISNASIEVAKNISKKGTKGVIVSASRPYSNLISLYKNNSIDLDRLFFIDCTSQPTGEKVKPLCEFVQTSANLTGISIALEDFSKKLEKSGFYFVDSISSMLIYNDKLTLIRFFHSLFVKMRTNNINGVMLMMKEDMNVEVRAEIGQLCDKIIKAI